MIFLCYQNDLFLCFWSNRGEREEEEINKSTIFFKKHHDQEIPFRADAFEHSTNCVYDHRRIGAEMHCAAPRINATRTNDHDR